MEDVRYKVRVECFNRLQIYLLICGIMCLAYVISFGIEKIFGIVVRGEVILLILLMLLCVVMSKWEHCFPSTLELDVEFTEEEVLFQKGKVKRKILRLRRFIYKRISRRWYPFIVKR